MGTLIRHARAASPVLALTVPMIEPPFRAPLVAAVGSAPLAPPSLGPARFTAIALPAVAVPADPEDRLASHT
jgi:hypothetical protein